MAEGYKRFSPEERRRLLLAPINIRTVGSGKTHAGVTKDILNLSGDRGFVQHHDNPVGTVYEGLGAMAQQAFDEEEMD